ncbi:MAG: SPASM domain-containing protein, partial [Candidatus Omnitrophota bacterium]
LGYPEFSVGNVSKRAFNKAFDIFSELNAWKQCPSDCPYVPMCQGGCRFFSFIENGNFHGLACRRGYLDRIMPELIKLEYEKLLLKSSLTAECQKTRV